jgi:arylsulfatase A-like enzyme
MRTDVTVSELLGREGYLNVLVADTYHLFKPDMNFHRGFHHFEWVRGAEYDGHAVGDLRRRRLEDFVSDRFDDVWRGRVLQFLRNSDDYARPEDYPCFRSVDAALRYLQEGRSSDRPKFLWLDTFQNHEPWLPPAQFDRYVPADYDGPRIILPMGGAALDWADEGMIACVRGLYAGEVAYVDWCMGRLLDGLRRMGYLDDTLVCVLSDHGHPLADHGKFLKGGDRMYSELLKVPLIMRFPGGRYGCRRLDALAQFPDLAPTWLEALGLPGAAHDMAGRSLMPLIRGEADSVRRATISGYYAAPDRAVRSRRHSYVVRPPGQPDELYDLIEDPRERRNILAEHPRVAAELASHFGKAYFPAPPKSQGLQGDSEVQHTPVG